MITKRTVLITASAIAIAAIAITAIFLMTSGISKADAENTASGYVPQGAEYIKTEIDDGVYEVTYRDNGLGREYEVHISRETGAIVGISMDSDRDHGGATAKLTAAQAEAAVKDEISGIVSAKVYQEKDDYGIFYDVEFTASDFYGSAEVNAETGAVVEYTIRYGSPVVIPSTGSASGNTQAGDDTAAKDETSAKDDNQASTSAGKTESNTQSGSQSGTQSNSQSSTGSSSGQSSAGSSQSQSGSQQPAQKPSDGTSQSGGSSTSKLISADKAKSIVLAKIGNNSAFIKELELDRDDGIYQYEGEAYYNGYEYDFEINASSGVIIKWEVDREDWD